MIINHFSWGWAYIILGVGVLFIGVGLGIIRNLLVLSQYGVDSQG